MSEATIDSLKLEIETSATRASGGLDALITTLDRLKSATRGGLGLTSVINQIRGVGDAARSIDSTSISNLEGLSNALQTLSSVGGLKLSASIANQITAISTALQGANFDNGADKMWSLVDALAPLQTLEKSNLSSYVTNLKKLPDVFTELNKIDMSAFRAKLQEVADALRPFADEMQKVANGFSAFPTKIQRLIASTNRLTDANIKASGSYTNLYHKLKMAWGAVKTISNKIAGWITLSNNYIETMNLFTVSMGQYAEEAYKDAQIIGDAMGIDPAEWMESQGIFMTLAKGFGVAGDRANTMSQQLTQLGYDLSSFFNISVEDAMVKLQSGISGELEPLRRLGYDLSQAKLEAVALSLGIDKAVSSMTQAEKAELRYYAIMKQVTDAHGDMARTLNYPANQLRILKAQVTQLGRALGDFFIPLLNKVLPYIIGAVKVLREVLDVFMDLLGIELTEVDFDKGSITSATDEVVSNLEDGQKEAKKLKSYMLGFDELNVLNTDDGSSLDDLLGTGFDFELPTYDFMDGIVATQVSGIVQKMKEWLGITEEIESWSDLLATNFGNIAVAVGIVAIGLAAWKISKLVKDVGKLKTAFKGISVFFKAIGIAAVSMAAIAGAAWLINNTEETMTKIGAIISAGALVVGSVLAFTGANIPLGIGLMAVGAVAMGASIAMNTNALSDEVKGVIAIITTAVSAALLAVGAVLAFTGVNIPLGIALMAGGALTMGSAVIPNWEKLSDDVKETISKITAIVGASLLGVGAILAFTGINIPLGIGLMATGALSLGTSIALNWDALPEMMRGELGKVVAIVGASLLAVGAILAFTGVAIPLGIALMVAGAVSLGTAAALNWDSIVKSMKGTTGKIVAIVGAASLAIGAILAFTGVGIPLGIGLMLAGAAALGTAVALNWDSIVKSIKGTTGKIMAIVGAAAMVIGLILLFTGVGIPLGLGLLLGGAASLGTAIAFNWDSIVNAVKGVWNKIKSFWNDKIAPIFTAKWWKDLGKKCINGLIAGFEGGINGIISGFESMINWVIGGLNKISVTIPDWVPLIGGKKFGVNLKTVSFSRVSIPRLAGGGFPDIGQMFIAREAGPELVGTIGNRTAVANNDQIVESVSAGVYQAVLAALGGNNDGGEPINIVVTLDGEKIYENQQRVARGRGYNFGMGAFSFG